MKNTKDCHSSNDSKGSSRKTGSSRNSGKPRKKKRLNPIAVVLYGAAVCILAVCVLTETGLFSLGRHGSSASSNTAETAELSSSSEETSPQQETPSGDEADRTAIPETEEESASEAAPPITLTVSCAGDCTLGTDINFDPSVNFKAYYNPNTPDYFFSNVADIFGDDDLTIVNLEGTFTESNERADKQFAFKGDPSYTEILTTGHVEACNMANNHSHDYGYDSYYDTWNAVESAGIIPFGYDETTITNINGISVGLVGIYELAKGIECMSDLEAAMEKVKDQGAQLILVSFHWGKEREELPTENQIALAHRAVDLGADLVVGHHPHVLQGIETYKGVNICYSLGNFCFGGNSNPSDKDTMIFQQTFTFENNVRIEDNQTNIIPCSVSAHSSYNDYRPTPATGEEAQRILDKIEDRSSRLP
ncbi:MAG: CapA family protein [Clostridiales bacterium]|nr:CapA family protein [Clostridiales bacterium]